MAIRDLRNRDSSDENILDEEFRKATKEQQIEWLCQIIQKEADKPEDQIDYDLIKECSDFLDELTANDLVYSPDEIEQKLKDQKEKNKKIDRNHASKRTMCSHLKRMRTSLKVALISALVFVLLFASVSIVAYAQGYRSAWDYIVANIQKIVGMEPGSQFTENGITIIKNSGSETYDTMEDLIQNEGLDILYPSKLPDGIQLKRIVQILEDDNQFTLAFQTTADDLSIGVSNYYKNNLELWTDYTTYATEMMTFYIIQVADGAFQAVGQKDNFEYSILYNDYNELISILENMKGIEK